MPDKDRVRVAVRVRPASITERVGAYKPMVRCVDGTLLVFDPDETSDGYVTSGAATRRRMGVRRAKNLQYAYDNVFDENTGQERVFDLTTRPLIEYVCQGYAATVFAYGATGSGKTHTMLGSAASGPGVMPMAIESLFNAMNQAQSEHAFALRLSYLEVMPHCPTTAAARDCHGARPQCTPAAGGRHGCLHAATVESPYFGAAHLRSARTPGCRCSCVLLACPQPHRAPYNLMDCRRCTTSISSTFSQTPTVPRRRRPDSFYARTRRRASPSVVSPNTSRSVPRRSMGPLSPPTMERFCLTSLGTHRCLRCWSAAIHGEPCPRPLPMRSRRARTRCSRSRFAARRARVA